MHLKFLTVFLLIAFVMKVVGEAVHEVMGHGLFVLLFGGRITGVHISALWPYELSGIRFDAPASGFQLWQGALIDGGGILICLVVSLVSQAILLSGLSKRVGWLISSMLFWLAFWTFINPAGYLIIGGIKPFGDIANVISAGVMTQAIALTVGLTLFLIGFFSLSEILNGVLRKAGAVTESRRSLVILWFTIPVLTVFYLIGQGGSLLLLPISLIPVGLAYAEPSLYRLIFSHWKMG